MRTVLIGAMVCAATLVVAQGAAPAFVLRDVTLIGGTGAAPHPHVGMPAAAGRISAIITPAASSLDHNPLRGRGRFLASGFFDNNAHLTVNGQPARRDKTGALEPGTGPIRALVDFGMSPLEAVRTATANGAAVILRSAELGTIDTGKLTALVLLGLVAAVQGRRPVDPARKPEYPLFYHRP